MTGIAWCLRAILAAQAVIGLYLSLPLWWLPALTCAASITLSLWPTMPTGRAAANLSTAGFLASAVLAIWWIIA